jgi:hypothetical protein
MLTFLKLIILLLFWTRLNPLVNTSFLLGFTIWAYKYDIILALREWAVYSTQSYFFSPFSLNLPRIYTDLNTFIFFGFRIPSKEFLEEGFRMLLLQFSVFIRLVIYSEPFIFSLFNFIFGYFLIFNNAFFFIFFYSLILSVSRFIFFSSDYSLSQMYFVLKQIDKGEGLKKGERLAITKRNVLAICFWIMRTYLHRNHEIYMEKNEWKAMKERMYKFKTPYYTFVLTNDQLDDQDIRTYEIIEKIHRELHEFIALIDGYENNEYQRYSLNNQVFDFNFSSSTKEKFKVKQFSPIYQEEVYYRIISFETIKPNYYFPYFFLYIFLTLLLMYISLKMNVKEIIII